MQQSSVSESYEFIDSSSNAGIPKGRHIRQLIRRQAMSRAAAHRKQKGNWGQQNRRQYLSSRPEIQDPVESENDAATTGTTKVDLRIRQRIAMSVESSNMAVPASVPSSGYELMRINYGFDLLDMSALTSFQTGRITAQLLMREPTRLAHVLQCRQWSFFSFLPSRYGHNTCLDDATHCVAARVRQWMSSPSVPPSDEVLSLYSKSLNSLQCGINDPVLCLQPEVLCATAILAIYELLDSAGNHAWVRHVAGASALMELRGPQRYQTDFEKALFMAQIGPIYTEALLNGDECFLEHDVWQNVFRSVVFDTRELSYSSGIVVSLWTSICPIPSLFKDVQNAICMPNGTDTCDIGSLFIRTQDIRASLSKWRQQFEGYTSFHKSPERPGDGMEYETLGIYMANLILVNRLGVSLNVRAASHLENEVQSLASGILEIERRASATNPRTSLFMAFKAVVAHAAIETSNEWQQAIEVELTGRANASSIINSHVFEHWVTLKGRKISSLTT